MAPVLQTPRSTETESLIDPSTRNNLAAERDFGLYQREEFSQLDSDADVKRIARVVDGRRHQVVRLVLAVEQMFQ